MSTSPIEIPDPDRAALPFLDLASIAFSTRSAAVRAARDKHWCARTPYGLAVLRHREVGALLRDRRLRQGSHAWPGTMGLEGSFAGFWTRSVISQEGQAHRQLRALAVPALAPEHIDALKPAFDEIAGSLADGLRGGTSCEFQSAFASPFAGQAIAVLLGLPPSDWQTISHDASALGLAMGVDAKQHEATFNAACDRLMDLADDLVARARRGWDRASYIARLVSRFDAAGLSNPQALRDLIVISIFGGVDTTRSQLGLGMALFVARPGQWQLLRADPSLVPNAIEEMIRTRPTTTWSTREAVEDFEFSGLTIRRGETLHMLVHASARDPAISPNDSFDITAPRRVHFGFGGGAHHCLGQYVARTDMASALTALSRVLSRFWFDCRPEWLPDSGNTSPVRLPLGYEITPT